MLKTAFIYFLKRGKCRPDIKKHRACLMKYQNSKGANLIEYVTVLIIAVAALPGLALFSNGFGQFFANAANSIIQAFN